VAADRVEAISKLLAETGQAHGRYEETELKGVYDQEWPTWYAAYAVEHGMSELIGHPITAEQLAAYFRTTNAEFEQMDPKPADPWAVYTARRIGAEL
jgi:hypothetical protein